MHCIAESSAGTERTQPVGAASHRTRPRCVATSTSDSSYGMAPHLPRNAPERTSGAQQKGRENPVHQRPRALGQAGGGEVVAGALAAVAPVAFAPGPVVICALRIDIVTVASGTLQRAILVK